jgi:spermidine synthase
MYPSGSHHCKIDDRRLLISPILASPAPFLIAKGVLRLIEPADANRRELIKEILAGNYAKPFVIDDGRKLSLHFSLAHVQSAMRIDEPFALELAYTRKMMAFLLFVPDPRQILIIGLGGGSLAKYCYRHLPRTRITAVEINPCVIAFREQFGIPRDDQRFRVVEADAVDYLANSAESADTIMLDGYDHHGITPSFCDKAFYCNLRRRLKAEGMLVANLSGERGKYQAHLDLMREVFEDRVLVLEVAGANNQIAFAFNSEDSPHHYRKPASDKSN